MSEQRAIVAFNGAFRFLSNFWTVDVVLDGVTYPSVENAYQAAKVRPEERQPFVNCSAAVAKRRGREVKIAADWEEVKVDIMRDLLAQKFAPGTRLAGALLDTGDATLIEGNTWGDTFWGKCRGQGRNMLGELLMAQRAALRRPAV